MSTRTIARVDGVRRGCAGASAARIRRERDARRGNIRDARARAGDGEDESEGASDEGSACARDGGKSASSRRAARVAFARGSRVARARTDGARESGARTMARAREAANAAGVEVRDVVWAPGLWASAVGGWTREEIASALRELEGANATALAERYARARDVGGCEAVYRACVDGGFYEEADRVALVLAKTLEWAPGRERDAEKLWAKIASETRGNAAQRAEAYCCMMEGLCLQPMRVKAFMEAYDEFRADFRDAATGEWKTRAATRTHVQRVYTAACRMINNSHNDKLARRVMYDLLRDHQYMRREFQGFALATDYCVCALLSAASPSMEHVAIELFEVALESGVALSGSTWSYAVSMYAGMKKVDEAIAMLDRLETLPFMQSGSLGALAFAAAFSFDKRGSGESEASAKFQKRAKELQIAEARHARERAKVERAYARVMRVLNEQGKFKLALRIFTRMQSSGVKPLSSETYVSLYDALSERTPTDDLLWKSVRRDNLHRVLQTIKSHLKGADALVVALEVAAHAGVSDVCDDIHDRLRWNGFLQTDVIRSRVWQCMMTVRCKSRDRQGTMQLYEEWSNENGGAGISVGEDFWFHLIKSYCDEPPNVDVAMSLLDRAIKESATVSRKSTPPRTFNVVIQACAQARRPALALEVLRRMRDVGVSPTSITYLFVLRSCESAAKIERPRGEGEDSAANIAKSLLNAAREDGVKPTPKMWSSALRACTRAVDVEAALEIFADMIADGCEPSVHACNALMSAHAANGDARAAVETYWTARREHGVTPDSTTLQTMLRAVGRGAPKDVLASAAEAYADMRELGIKPNNEIVSLLSESTIAGDVTRIFIDEVSDDVATEIDLRERSVPEARVVVLELLQTLRNRAAASRRAPISTDVRIVTGRGKVRDEIEKLALDVSLVLAYAADDDATIVLSPDAVRHWLTKP